jgi:DNA-binding GntR family transcriptional regulator
MEQLLEALGHSLSLHVAERLLLEGPETQEALRQEFGSSKKSMSDAVKRLDHAGLVQRERARGPMHLRHQEKVHALLQMAADLECEILEGRKEQASDRARALRKAQMSGSLEDTETA